jgi:thiol-disulfide isomerase/thioredoxin
MAVAVLSSAAFAVARPAVRVIGRAAPELSIDAVVQAPTGTTITLEALRGKAVMLDCWATWCGPCVEAIPHLNALADRFRSKPLQFVALSNEDPAKVRAFLTSHPMKAWVACDPDNSTEKDYRTPELPITFLIDTSGTLKGMMPPSQITDEVLQHLLRGEPLQ